MHVFGELRSPPDACCNAHTNMLKWPPTLGKVPVLPVGGLPAHWNGSFLFWYDFCTFDSTADVKIQLQLWPWLTLAVSQQTRSLLLVSLLWPQRLSVVVSSLQELQSRNLWKVMLAFWTWNGTETNLTLTGCLQVTHTRLERTTNTPPEAVLAPLDLIRTPAPPRGQRGEMHLLICTWNCCSETLLPVNFALRLNILASQPELHCLSPELTANELRIILMTPVYALPGHICIYYIAELQTSPSQRQLQTAVARTSH